MVVVADVAQDDDGVLADATDDAGGFFGMRGVSAIEAHDGAVLASEGHDEEGLVGEGRIWEGEVESRWAGTCGDTDEDPRDCRLSAGASAAVTDSRASLLPHELDVEVVVDVDCLVL